MDPFKNITHVANGLYVDGTSKNLPIITRFLLFLQQNHPLNCRSGAVNLHKKDTLPPIKGHAVFTDECTGRFRGNTNDDGTIHFNIDLTLGKKESKELWRTIRTLAHEYGHALQVRDDREMTEEDADEFALASLKLFTSSYPTLLSTPF